MKYHITLIILTVCMAFSSCSNGGKTPGNAPEYLNPSAHDITILSGTGSFQTTGTELLVFAKGKYSISGIDTLGYYEYTKMLDDAVAVCNDNILGDFTITLTFSSDRLTGTFSIVGTQGTQSGTFKRARYVFVPAVPDPAEALAAAG